MTQIFDEDEAGELSRIVFDSRPPIMPNGWPGYKPSVREVPNGDGRVDAGKRYAHVALKYLAQIPESCLRSHLEALLARAHFFACRVAEALNVPAEFYPRVADGTLRIVEYPAGVGGEEHTDMDLFTVPCYRSDASALKVERNYVRDRLADALALCPGLHVGEIGQLVGLGPANVHYVEPRPVPQRSIVYFAMPNHVARLPVDLCTCPRPDWHGHTWKCVAGKTVGEWLTERYARSRVPA